MDLKSGLVVKLFLVEIFYILSRNYLLNTILYDIKFIETLPSWILLRFFYIALMAIVVWPHRQDFTWWSKPIINMPVIIIIAGTITFGLIIIHPLGLTGGFLELLPTRIMMVLDAAQVAFREEFVYRLVLLRVMMKYLIFPVSLLISSLLFSVYHIGALPLEALKYVFVYSVLFGLLYKYSGRSYILLVVTHFTIDAYWLLM